MPETTSYTDNVLENSGNMSANDINGQNTDVFNFEVLTSLIDSSFTTESTTDNRNDYERIFNLQESPGTKKRLV